MCVAQSLDWSLIHACCRPSGRSPLYHWSAPRPALTYNFINQQASAYFWKKTFWIQPTWSRRVCPDGSPKCAGFAMQRVLWPPLVVPPPPLSVSSDESIESTGSGDRVSAEESCRASVVEEAIGVMIAISPRGVCWFSEFGFGGWPRLWEGSNWSELSGGCPKYHCRISAMWIRITCPKVTLHYSET